MHKTMHRTDGWLWATSAALLGIASPVANASPTDKNMYTIDRTQRVSTIKYIAIAQCE
jgi:hypothetical protein